VRKEKLRWAESSLLFLTIAANLSSGQDCAVLGTPALAIARCAPESGVHSVQLKFNCEWLARGLFRYSPGNE
jgi:hypothetical protein